MRAGLSHGKAVREAWASLLGDGSVVEAKVVKNGRGYDGWKLDGLPEDGEEEF